MSRVSSVAVEVLRTARADAQARISGLALEVMIPQPV